MVSLTGAGEPRKGNGRGQGGAKRGGEAGPQRRAPQNVKGACIRVARSHPWAGASWSQRAVASRCLGEERRRCTITAQTSSPRRQGSRADADGVEGMQSRSLCGPCPRPRPRPTPGHSRLGREPPGRQAASRQGHNHKGR